MKKLLIVSLFLTSCIGGSEIKPNSKWQDIGKPASYENTYTVVKVEDGYVFDRDYEGTVHRVSIDDFKKYCIEKQEL